MSEIEIHVTRSSSLDKLTYDTDTQELKVRFTSGAEYKYENVSNETFHALANAESIGKYFQMHIKDKFKTTKL